MRHPRRTISEVSGSERVLADRAGIGTNDSGRSNAAERAPSDSRGFRQQQGENRMKITTALVVAVGLGALAACQQKTENNAAENMEMNAETTTTTTEMNTTENMEMNAGNAMEMNATENNAMANTVTNNAY
jgi:uncharacterized protein HemX